MEATFNYLQEIKVQKIYLLTRSNNRPMLRIMNDLQFQKIGFNKLLNLDFMIKSKYLNQFFSNLGDKNGNN